jgi:hypothetical protein
VRDTVTALLVVAMSGCGTSERGADNSAGSGNSGIGGAGIGGAGGAAGNATSGSGGATAGQGAAGAAAGKASACDSHSASLSWNGASPLTLTRTTGLNDAPDAVPPIYQFFFKLDADGFAVFRGEGEPLAAEATGTGAALLLMPTGAPEAGSWFYGAQGSTFMNGSARSELSMSGLGRLGACSDGDPVDGTVTVVADGIATGSSYHRSGTLDGTAVESADFSTFNVDEKTNVAVGYHDAMLIRYERDDPFAASGSLLHAFVLTPPGSPWGDAIFCAGLESSYDGLPNDRMVQTLTGFRRLSVEDVGGTNTFAGCTFAKSP